MAFAIRDCRRCLNPKGVQCPTQCRIAEVQKRQYSVCVAIPDRSVRQIKIGILVEIEVRVERKMYRAGRVEHVLGANLFQRANCQHQATIEIPIMLDNRIR